MSNNSTQTGHGIEVGTVLVAMWGYDQTNVDFYEVTRATAATVTLVAIAQRPVEATSDMSETVEPIVGDHQGEPFRRKVHTAFGGVRVDEVALARPWNGTPIHQSHWA